MDHTPPPFFNRGPSPLARLAFFVVLSIAVMAADARFNQLAWLRQTLAVLAHPLQLLANSPAVLAQRSGEFFVTQTQLADENARLRQQRLENAAQLLRYQSLQAENAYLRKLFNTQQTLNESAILAEVLYAGRDPFTRRIVVDKGSTHGVKAGQAAIDDVGLVGQVTRVYPLSSEITLLADKGQAVPVEVMRNGLRAIAFGHGEDNTLDLVYMPVNVEIENGDTLVTSGIDGTYPRGLPVAVVSKIERNAAYPFARITCTPSAGIDRHKQLLIVASNRAEATDAAPPAAANDAPVKGRNGKHPANARGN